MATYKWIKTNITLRRLEDGACIPADLSNRDYAEFVKSGAIAQAEDAPPTVDQNAANATDAIDRLQFDIAFNIENRVRALEAKIAVTKAQYRDALVARWKVLNP